MKYETKFHPDFFKDLKQLGNRELKIFDRKKIKIEKNPLRLKHLSGGTNTYREPITRNIRVIYYVHKNSIWYLTIGNHDDSYKKFGQRLLRLKRNN
jgi:mRNA-degrading endonuclease RelE of RelBE toxin-antitoxin system